MRKNLKNYTTEIDYNKTINEIETFVVQKMRATQFFKEYKEGIIDAVVFVIPTDKGYLPFKLPARVEKVKIKIYGQRNWYSDAQENQARRTAWRNVYAWIDAQYALIEADQVKVEEVFLPYMTDKSGRTIFELMVDADMNVNKLGSGQVEEGIVE